MATQGPSQLTGFCKQFEHEFFSMCIPYLLRTGVFGFALSALQKCCCRGVNVQQAALTANIPEEGVPQRPLECYEDYLKGVEHVRGMLNIKLRRIAVLIIVSRLFAWHLLQPGLFFLAYRCSAPYMSTKQIWLGACVALREAMYLALIVACLCRFPAIFLFAPGRAARRGDIICYICAPEKFLDSALANAGYWWIGVWLMYIFFVLDICALVALVDQVVSGPFWPLLAISYSLVALSCVGWFVTFLVTVLTD